jgi:hypothetical protein
MRDEVVEAGVVGEVAPLGELRGEALKIVAGDAAGEERGFQPVEGIEDLVTARDRASRRSPGSPCSCKARSASTVASGAEASTAGVLALAPPIRARSAGPPAPGVASMAYRGRPQAFGDRCA